MGTGEFIAEGGGGILLVTLYATKSRVSFGLMGHLVRIQTLFLTCAGRSNETFSAIVSN